MCGMCCMVSLVSSTRSQQSIHNAADKFGKRAGKGKGAGTEMHPLTVYRLFQRSYSWLSAACCPQFPLPLAAVACRAM